VKQANGGRHARRFSWSWRLDIWLGLNVYGIYARALAPPAQPMPPAIDRFVHCMFEAGDVERLLACTDLAAMDLTEDFLRDAFAKGDVCDAVLCDGRLVSYTWMAFSTTHHVDGVWVEFAGKYRYAYKAYTDPAFRGQHAIRLFKAASDGYCISRGRTHTITFIALDNRSSIRYAMGVGNQRIGVAGYLKWGRFFVSFRTPAVRRESFRFFQPPAA
jgi:hypothetical protein